MSVGTYLETLPLNEIAKYGGGPPKNALPFAGYPRQHPSEKNKLILIYDPLGMNPSVLEFKIEDVLYVEELHSAVNLNGEGVPLVKLWVRKGAHGVIIEPFEVDEPIQFADKKEDLRERFQKIRFQAPVSGAAGASANRTGPKGR
jgi:inorganic pyrophosphatase